MIIRPLGEPTNIVSEPIHVFIVGLTLPGRMFKIHLDCLRRAFARVGKGVRWVLGGLVGPRDGFAARVGMRG